MKVALLSHEGGGISTVCHGLARSLSEKKIQTTIFSTTAARKPQVGKINDHLDVIRLPVIDYPPRSLWFHLKNSDRLSKMLKDYDVIHAVSPEMAIPFVLFKKLDRPLIVTMHGSHRAALRAFVRSSIRKWGLGDFLFNVMELPLHEATTKWCFDGSDRVVVCSYWTLAEIRRHENVDVSKATVIHNGIDFDDIDRNADANEGKKDDEKRPTMLYAGRLFWMKGISYVLEAFEEVKKDVEEAQLRIFGKGPMKNQIEKFVRQNKLQHDVFFGGFLPHRELMKEIEMSDVAVFPSLYESQPMFLLEAMACRKPLVAFDLPYAREIISDGHNGLLARLGDIEDFVANVKSVLLDEDLGKKIGQNAYDYVKQNHDWKKQAEKYIELYEETTEARADGDGTCLSVFQQRISTKLN